MRALILAATVATAAPAIACGAHGSSAVGDYDEYICPPPIGPIVRENCAASTLRYDGVHFDGAAGFSTFSAKATYQDSAIREADALVAMLKEQRGQLCQNFNTCKLSLSEFRERQRVLDDSYVALLALRDASSNGISPERALEGIRALRPAVEITHQGLRKNESSRQKSTFKADDDDDDDDGDD